MPVLVTGAAGFIGYHVCDRLLQRGEYVIGVDSFDPYYSVHLKRARALLLHKYPRFSLHEGDIVDTDHIRAILDPKLSWRVIHLAAQAGVRYSLSNPMAYGHSNMLGHLSILEACRGLAKLEHLVYASSSSVYGVRKAAYGAFQEQQRVDHPTSLYAATKRAAELMSQSYCSLFGLPQSGLRFFTVYGPLGRPDMAYYSFTTKISAGAAIEVFNGGDMLRDFTYIDDAVTAVLGVLDHPPLTGEHRLLNVASGSPVGLMRLIESIESALGQQARVILAPHQPGDVPETFGDISRIASLIGFKPQTEIGEGIEQFVAWYKSYNLGPVNV